VIKTLRTIFTSITKRLRGHFEDVSGINVNYAERPYYCHSPSYTQNHDIYLRPHINEAVRLLVMRAGVGVKQGGQREMWVLQMVPPVAKVREE